MDSPGGTIESNSTENLNDLNDNDLQLKFNHLLSSFKNVNCSSEDCTELASGLTSGLNFAECALVVIERAVHKLRVEEEMSSQLRSRVKEREAELEIARTVVNETVRRSESKLGDERKEVRRLEEELESVRESHVRETRALDIRLSKKDEEIERLRACLSQVQSENRSVQVGYIGRGSVLNAEVEHQDLPQVHRNFFSKEDFLSLLKASETSILDKVQGMFEREKNDSGFKTPSANITSGQHVKVIEAISRPRNVERFSTQGVEVSDMISRPKREEWYKFCKTITRFKPEANKEQGIDEYLTSLRSKLKTVNPPYSNREKVSVVRMTLEGSAQIALESYPGEVQNDFELLCGRLIRDFGRFSCEDAAIAALKGKEGKQATNERPAEYARRLQELCSKAYGKAFKGRDDIQLRIAFTEGLIPPMKDKAEALALSNLDEVVSKAEIFYHKLKPAKPKEAVHVYRVGSETEQGPDLRLEGNGSEAQGGKDKTPSEPADKRPPKSSKPKGSGCFRCGRYGHLARDCTAQLPSEQDQSKFGSLIEHLGALIQRMDRAVTAQVSSSS